MCNSKTFSVKNVVSRKTRFKFRSGTAAPKHRSKIVITLSFHWISVWNIGKEFFGFCTLKKYNKNIDPCSILVDFNLHFRSCTVTSQTRNGGFNRRLLNWFITKLRTCEFSPWGTYEEPIGFVRNAHYKCNSLLYGIGLRILLFRTSLRISNNLER